MMLDGCFLLVKEPLLPIPHASSYLNLNNVGHNLFRNGFIWHWAIKKLPERNFWQLEDVCIVLFLFFEMGINLVE
ncbi:MAG: hypothetical protein ACWA6U_08155 [Breznakibacter sp.]